MNVETEKVVELLKQLKTDIRNIARLNMMDIDPKGAILFSDIYDLVDEVIWEVKGE